MSYIRWGNEGSHVYVIGEDGESGPQLRCVACDSPGRTSSSRSAFIEHLDAHRGVGFVVPDSLYEQLRREIDLDGDQYSFRPMKAEIAEYYAKQ